jgi:hypothetical protein
MEFEQKNLGVIVCGCVFKNEKPILYVYHGKKDWQFLCGGEHESTEDAKVVGIGHLTERDLSLDQLADLPAGWEADRKSNKDEWARNEAE